MSCGISTAAAGLTDFSFGGRFWIHDCGGEVYAANDLVELP